jgi:FlaA1/EpsC-like NDP-sugar epimerase
MGEQVRILDVARNLIRLAGHVPDEDIPITFIGLRPGEKLHEELTTGGEALEPSGVEKILRVRSKDTLDGEWFADTLAVLIEKAMLGDHGEVIRQLRRIVPTFNCRPTGKRYHTVDEIDRYRQPGIANDVRSVEPAFPAGFSARN